MRTVPASRILAKLVVTGIMLMGGVQSSKAVAWRWPYFCFFEPGSAELSDRCKSIVKAAVESWHMEQQGRQLASDRVSEGLTPAYTAHIEVWGYAQDAGDPKENHRLSMGRALAVAEELKKLGVPDNFVTVVGLGDADPRVPDAPMDPENRRSQIILW